MDTKKVPHVSINRYMSLSVGLWPTDRKILRRFQKSIISAILISSFYPQIGALVKYRDNYNTCCKIVMCIIPTIVYIIKFFSFAFETEHRMRRTLEWIQADWETYIKKGERVILEERGKKSRALIILHIAVIYPAVIANAMFPYVRYGYNCLTQQNGTILLKAPMLLEYYILDERKYMHWIVLHFNMFYLVGSHIVIVTEATSLMIVEHACALFELVSHCVFTAVEETIAHPSKFVIRRYTKMIVQVHCRALSFVAFLNDTYMLHYTVILVFGVLALTLNLYIFAGLIMKSYDLDALILVVVLIICHLCYMLFCTHAGQKIIDQSTLIFTESYCSRWYLTPLPMQKFFVLFMERSLKTSCFISGGIIKPCLQLLSSLLSTAMSYFMVLWSLL